MGRGILRHGWILAIMCLMVGCPSPATDTVTDTNATRRHASPEPEESTTPEPTDSPSDAGTTEPEPTASPTPTPEAMRVITLAGHFTNGYTDGTGEMARFMAPRDLDVDAAGDIYVADSHAHAIRKLDPETGEVTTVAGNGMEGDADGTKAEARFSYPWGLAIASGVIFVADTNNNVIRKIDLTVATTDPGYVTTIAGGEKGYKDDPVATAAMFDGPSGLAFASDRNMLYAADTNNCTIRAIDLESGRVSTVAGQEQVARPRNDFKWEWYYQDGPASTARFFLPRGIEYDAEREALYVADNASNHIRRIDLAASGLPVTTLAGDGSEGDRDGSGASARFNSPVGLSLDGHGDLWVTDWGNHKIRKIHLADKTVTTVVGGAKDEDIDGPVSEAQLYYPRAIHVASDAVYFSTAFKIRKLTLP